MAEITPLPDEPERPATCPRGSAIAGEDSAGQSTSDRQQSCQIDGALAPCSQPRPCPATYAGGRATEPSPLHFEAGTAAGEPVLLDPVDITVRRRVLDRERRPLTRRERDRAVGGTGQDE